MNMYGFVFLPFLFSLGLVDSLASAKHTKHKVDPDTVAFLASPFPLFYPFRIHPVTLNHLPANPSLPISSPQRGEK